MPQSSAPTIAVIGAGFSGVMTALHLLSRSSDTQIMLFETGAAVGLGLAYATHDPQHLLNVRAGNMSAWPDRPGHFVDWLAGQGMGLGASDFATRADYGRYLQSQFADGAVAQGRLVVTSEAVVSLDPQGDGWRLGCAGGRVFDVGAVVLAVGNPLPARPAGIDEALAASEAYVADPWRWDAGRLADGPTLLIGAGLTMVDVALSLEAARPGRPILALSRRGLAPLAHADAPVPPIAAPPQGLSPLDALAWLKRAAREHDWRVAIDAARPVTQAWWRAWSAAQRATFLRHARPFWDIHRHRLAPEVGRRVLAMRACGQLSIVAGKILGLSLQPDGLALCRWRGRGGDQIHVALVAAVINCTGPSGDVLASSDPLIRHLVERGLARPDPLRLGFDVDHADRLRDRSGRPWPTLFAVGAATRGAHWEITAAPDIRNQAAVVAGAVLEAVS